MRPDHLVVGEVRGAEVRDLLAALSTGHAGATTVHAASPLEVTDRFAHLCEAAGLDARAAVRRFRSAVGALVHVERDAMGRRRVSGVWGWSTAGHPVRRDLS
jgi:pilus assembly protein CpaF